ncbi:hypothetical protein KBTX_03559 [wastewater metagenome]|uniref:Uncharacterized protein n=2 Tax=unclassified sequences TaxID=12908 RepID=A0A5B8RF02_9ZZZZ|nr:hypothetical protein [Arhodomonas sp. KWT]QEA07211.1 hypothetical protein KBTEX_03559 [uncultured organism]
MRQTKSFVLTGLAILAVMAMGPVSAELKNLETAIEAARITLTEAGGGRLEIEVSTCELCETREFDVRNETRFIHEGQELNVQRFPRGRAVEGTVIYDNESGELTKVLW